MAKTPKNERRKPAVMTDLPSINDAIRQRAYQLWEQERHTPNVNSGQSDQAKNNPKKGVKK